jgi:hypothetical protein
MNFGGREATEDRPATPLDPFGSAGFRFRYPTLDEALHELTA